MKEFKGTPGPWFVSPRNDLEVTGHLNVIQTHGSNCRGYYIAYASGWTDETSTRIEASNNAHLIAAAPELLEALQDLVALVKSRAYPQPDKPSSDWGRAEAAQAIINKALGE